MNTNRVVESCLAVALFVGYLGLWRLKRWRDIRRHGIDPEVLARASTPMQRFFASLVRFITILVVAVLSLHSFAPETWVPLVRLATLDSPIVDWVGFVVGVVGLGLCGIAQATMGSSWRVGIDHDRETKLVTRGLYQWIRNPTYLGLHLLNLGLWLIWPTTLVAAYAVLFFVVMDIQVRCEEEFLMGVHGEEFTAYRSRTRRYFPWFRF